MAELKSDLMEALQREVRSLDDDSWLFAVPWSCINLVSWPGEKRTQEQGILSQIS
ncbi:hypothetical protein BDA96_03G464600 [Sorghum bicolor]|uniref:Uncharacterized protein n=1 Tax=Sorghum bicolor TaxID=4558 RepID=A0A921RIU6_SORBI|nr:hypothetical protein BDA96_03G464600 [Sorghum bicolor]